MMPYSSPADLFDAPLTTQTRDRTHNPHETPFPADSFYGQNFVTFPPGAVQQYPEGSGRGYMNPRPSNRVPSMSSAGNGATIGSAKIHGGYGGEPPFAGPSRFGGNSSRFAGPSGAPGLGGDDMDMKSPRHYFDAHEQLLFDAHEQNSGFQAGVSRVPGQAKRGTGPPSSAAIAPHHAQQPHINTPKSPAVKIKKEENISDHGSPFASALPNMRAQNTITNPGEGNSGENEDEDSDDDVPLIKRVLSSNSRSPENGHDYGRVSQSTDSILGKLSPEPRDTMKRREHDRPSQTSAGPADEGEGLNISWKLPDYEGTYITDPSGFPTAKISLPGLIRETLLLSPDHSVQEFHLLTSLFLPSHRTTYFHPSSPTSPSYSTDPTPALSLLNFHTICILVIEAYHTVLSTRSIRPEDSDTDEIFLIALDNWRVGCHCGRRNYQAVRGVQEFCDVALDIVFWIKERGFVGAAEEGRQRRERSDKGVKRGPRGGGGVGEDDGAGEGRKRAERSDKGAKRSSGRPKVNTLQARSKGKGGKMKGKGGRVEKKRH